MQYDKKSKNSLTPYQKRRGEIIIFFFSPRRFLKLIINYVQSIHIYVPSCTHIQTKTTHAYIHILYTKKQDTKTHHTCNFYTFKPKQHTHIYIYYIQRNRIRKHHTCNFYTFILKQHTHISIYYIQRKRIQKHIVHVIFYLHRRNHEFR